MVYLYKKIIGKKPYYYLRASERKGKKVVVKDIAYLGSSIEEVKKELEKSEYKDKVRKAYRTIHNFIESNHFLEKVEKLKLKKDIFLQEKLSEVEACKLHYNQVFKRNDKLTKEEILKNFVIEFAYNTTSIEGNTITLRQAKNLLEDGRTPKNKTLREIYDLQNTEKVFFDLIGSKKEISHDLIIRIHEELMNNIDDRMGYRTRDVRVIRANFKATPAPFVKTDMELLLKWYNQFKKKLHPFVLGILFHHKFEKIHPFYDGNGRTGRILLNYILMENNYPPLIVHNKTRDDYLKMLRKADKGAPKSIERDDYLELVQFIADEMINSYWNIFL